MSDTLQRAVAAVKAGDKAAGRRLLAEVIRADPRNVSAWLWMAAATDADEQRRACLERVLAINPDNQSARQGLARLGFATQPPVVPPAGAPPEPVAPPAARPARRARAALPPWSLLIALGATIVVCATAGIAAYLALSSVVGLLRGRLKIHFAPAWPE